MSTQPLTAAKFRELDSNGAPLSGGKLFTYAAGTTTPLATYTDYTGNVANANPVILDSAGRADVWLTPGTLYKLVLQDSAGNLIYTEDNFQVSGSGNAQLSQPNTFTAANVFSPAATNTTAVAATGNGTGAGLVATGGTASATGAILTGGSPNGGAVFCQGVGTGPGGTFVGGPSSGTGGVNIGGAPNGAGSTGLGAGTGQGVNGVGGSSGGNGGTFAGGGLSGHGVTGTGAGTGAGGVFNSGTASTGGAPTNAIVAGQGNIGFSSTANPSSNIGFANTITPKNICKAWGTIHTNGSGGASVLEGFNIASASATTTLLTINLTTPMLSANYVALGTSDLVNAVISDAVAFKTASAPSFTGDAAGTSVNWAGTISTFSFVVFGAQ